MKKIINIAKIAITTIMLTSCTSDDNNTLANIEQEEVINKIVYLGDHYEINHFEYTSFGGHVNLELYNKSGVELEAAFDGGELLSGVDYFYIEIGDSDIRQKTYDLSEIGTLYFLLNAEIEEGDIEKGNTILSTKHESLRPISGLVNVTKVTSTDLEFSFEFSRTDGEVITGVYKGSNNHVVEGNR